MRRRIAGSINSGTYQSTKIPHSSAGSSLALPSVVVKVNHTRVTIICGLISFVRFKKLLVAVYHCGISFVKLGLERTLVPELYRDSVRW
jgi:hypothetical protein